MKKTLLQKELEHKVAKLQVHAQRLQHVAKHYEQLKKNKNYNWGDDGDLFRLVDSINSMFYLDELNPNEKAPYGLDTFQPERVKI